MSCICKQVTRKMNLETYENVNRKITLALSPLFSRGNAASVLILLIGRIQLLMSHKMDFNLF